MTEEEAKGWIAGRFGDPAVERLTSFVDLVLEENGRQNLIAPSTENSIWVRHVVDSAQLMPFAKDGLWIDIGTGGGFPGMVVAMLRSEPILLVEPRRRRADFLQHAADTLKLGDVTVAATKVEKVVETASVVSARAVALVENLLHVAAGCANEETRWLLPRGRSAHDDLELVSAKWRGMFHVEHSVTDPEAAILVLEGVRRR